jgi:predicted permease
MTDLPFSSNRSGVTLRATLDRWRQHVLLSIRSLRRSPGFALAAVVTLGGGIGLNTAIFTVFYALAFRPLPVRDAESLVNVYQKFSGRYGREVHGSASFVSYEDFNAYSAAGPALARSAVYADVELSLGGSTTPARGELVSCGYFETLGTRMALGRSFTPDECGRIGDGPSVVLSHATWLREFGGDSAIVGRRISLNTLPFTVVGVAEPGFKGLQILSAGMWVPVTKQPALAHGRDSIITRAASWLVMVSRLSAGATREQVKAQLDVVAQRLDQAHPGRRTQIVVTPGAFLNSPEIRQDGVVAAGMLAGLGVIVVVIVAANVMNLLLARGIARRREIGIRLAIGASRRQLIEQLLAESLLLALLGGLVGLLIARLLPPLVFGLVPVSGMQADASLDVRVFGFTLAICAVTALVFGLAPALQSTNVDLVSASRGTMTLRGRPMRTSRLRGFVIGVQIAGSALLLTVASLFLRATLNASSIDPGYETRGIASFGLNLSQLGYDSTRVATTMATLARQLAESPGVEAAAITNRMPLLGRTTYGVELPPNAGSTKPRIVDEVLTNFVSADYFSTMRIPIVAGRAFTDREAREGGTHPAVVSASLARKLWPGESALGKEFKVSQWRYYVSGIARDTRMVTLGEVSPFLYQPIAAMDNETPRLVARAADAAAAERALKALAQAIDPAIVVTTEPFEERLHLEQSPARIGSMVAAATGVLAILLAVVGIYGVVSYGMGQRTREIAVRVALGATNRSVVQLMMRQARMPIVAGLAIGTAAAAAVAQVMKQVLYEISPIDPIAFGAMATVVVSASLLATYLPSRRAASIDPAMTLRDD